MYQVLFRIGNPQSVAYESILRNDIAKHPMFERIGINPLSHTFLVIFDEPSFDRARILNILAEYGLNCSIEWIRENRSHIEHSIALEALRGLVCRLFGFFGLSFFGYWIFPSKVFLIIATLLEYIDTLWTHHLISKNVPSCSHQPIYWIGVTTLNATILCILGRETYGYIVLTDLLLFTLSSALNIHTKILYEMDRIKDSNASWKTIKVVRKGIHDFIEVPIDALVGGEFVLVQIGDVFPADGTITSGTTIVDDSWLDGKTTYLAKYEGDQVLAGSINITASILMITSKSRKNSLFHKVHHHIVPQKKIIKCKMRKHWLPLLLAILGHYFFVNLVTLVTNNNNYTLHQMLVDIVCSFPSLSVWANSIVYSFARWHLHNKHGNEAHVPNIYAFKKPLNSVIFKKKFLTRGRKVLRDIITLPSSITIEIDFHSSFSKGAVLLIAASIQRHINRDIAKALLDAYIPNSTQKKPEEAIEIVASMLSFSCIEPDQGIEASFHGSNILMGTPYWLAQKGKIDLSIIRDWTDTCLLKDEHVEVMSLEGTIIAAFSFSEHYLDNISQIIENLYEAKCCPFIVSSNVDDPKLSYLGQPHRLNVLDTEGVKALVYSQKNSVAVLSFKQNDWEEDLTFATHINLYTNDNYHSKSPISMISGKEELIGKILLFINDHLNITKQISYFGYFWSLCTIMVGRLSIGLECHTSFIMVFQLIGAVSIVFLVSKRYKGHQTKN